MEKEGRRERLGYLVRVAKQRLSLRDVVVPRKVWDGVRRTKQTIFLGKGSANPHDMR